MLNQLHSTIQQFENAVNKDPVKWYTVITLTGFITGTFLSFQFPAFAHWVGKIIPW